MLYRVVEDGEDVLLTRWIQIPSAIATQLCQCMRSRGNNTVYRDGSKGDPPLDWPSGRCTKCRRYDISKAYTCRGCNKHYIKDFKHPNWCLYHNPNCWNCVSITELTPKCGPDKCPGLRHYHDIKPPVSELHKHIKIEIDVEDFKIV